MATLYVAATGDDNNDGSVSTPYASLFQALCHIDEGDTIYIKAGDYTGIGGNHLSLKGLSGVTYDNASNALISPGAFAGYTWQEGDRIRIRSAAGSGNPGLYEIAAKLSDNAIELGTGFFHTSNLSDIETYEIAHGEIVRSGVSVAVNCQIIGYTSTTDDDGVVTLDGLDHGLYTEIEDNTGYNFIHNLQFTGQALAGVKADDMGYMCFENCTVDADGESTEYGFTVGNSCAFHGCAVYGCEVGIKGNDDLRVYGSYAQDCDDGIDGWTNSIIQFCSVDNCSGDGIKSASGVVSFCTISGVATGVNFFYSSGNQAVLNCTIDGLGAAGTKGVVAYSPDAMVVNNIIYDVATGIQGMTDYGTLRPTYHNLIEVASGGTAYSNWSGAVDDLTGDPEFYDDTIGDYRLRPSSPARAAAEPAWMDIGAHQRKEPSAPRERLKLIGA